MDVFRQEDRQMKKTICTVFLMIGLGGCQDQVDKCVAQWQRATPKNSEEWCSDEKGADKLKCIRDYNQQYADDMLSARFYCMKLSNGT